MTIKEFTAPSAWASYLINNDASGLDADEIHAANQWLDWVKMGRPVSCEDAGCFMRNHSARQFSPFIADCQYYTFIN